MPSQTEHTGLTHSLIPETIQNRAGMVQPANSPSREETPKPNSHPDNDRSKNQAFEQNANTGGGSSIPEVEAADALLALSGGDEERQAAMTLMSLFNAEGSTDSSSEEDEAVQVIDFEAFTSLSDEEIYKLNTDLIGDQHLLKLAVRYSLADIVLWHNAVGRGRPLSLDELNERLPGAIEWVADITQKEVWEVDLLFRQACRKNMLVANSSFIREELESLGHTIVPVEDDDEVGDGLGTEDKSEADDNADVEAPENPTENGVEVIGLETTDSIADDEPASKRMSDDEIDNLLSIPNPIFGSILNVFVVDEFTGKEFVKGQLRDFDDLLRLAAKNSDHDLIAYANWYQPASMSAKKLRSLFHEAFRVVAQHRSVSATDVRKELEAARTSNGIGHRDKQGQQGKKGKKSGKGGKGKKRESQEHGHRTKRVRYSPASGVKQL